MQTYYKMNRKKNGHNVKKQKTNNFSFRLPRPTLKYSEPGQSRDFLGAEKWKNSLERPERVKSDGRGVSQTALTLSPRGKQRDRRHWEEAMLGNRKCTIVLSDLLTKKSVVLNIPEQVLW